MVVDALLIVVGLVLAVAGVFAGVVPVLPGPLMSYCALLIISWVREWEPFSAPVLMALGGLTLILSVLDNVIPAVGAKKAGASRQGIWGAAAGMLFGMIVFPPWGIFFGAFAGAVIGEMMSGALGRDAVRIGWGVFLGSMMGIALKLGFSITLLILYVLHMF